MSISDQPVVRIYLTGTFKVELEDGSNLTPTSMKAQALIALLATAKNGERGRAWLKSKLWSDRAPEQAAGSLRQCLVQLRRTFEQVPGLIKTSRQNIAINLKLIEKIATGRQDFLEGIDVRDEEFEDWLRSERQSKHPMHISAQLPKKATTAPQIAKKSIAIKCSPEVGELGWLARQVTDTICRMLRETFSVDVTIGDDPSQPDRLLHAEVEAFAINSNMASLRMALACPQTKTQIWANSKSVKVNGALDCEHPKFTQLGNQLVEAIGDQFFAAPRLGGDCPDLLCRTAIRNLFEISPESVLAADRMFAQAYELNPRGLYLAWRAQAKTIMKIERHQADADALSDEAEALCKKALELEPRNSMVLATVANTYGQLFRSFEMGAFLAKQSVNLNSANPMAWFALSSTKMYAGKNKDSLRCAIRAHQLSDTSPYRFWWDSQVFGASLMRGHLLEAQHFAEQCHIQRPKFKPPLRYLVALYANADKFDLAEKMAAKLQDVEEDFSIDRLVNDDGYPASVLHRDIGIDLDKVASLS